MNRSKVIAIAFATLMVVSAFGIIMSMTPNGVNRQPTSVQSDATTNSNTIYDYFITLSGVPSGSGTYQQLLTLNPSDYGINSQGSNIQFKTSNGTDLNAWIENINATAMNVWVKNFDSSTTIIMMVYPTSVSFLSSTGDLGSGTQYFNAYKVFPFATDFTNTSGITTTGTLNNGLNLSDGQYFYTNSSYSAGYFLTSFQIHGNAESNTEYFAVSNTQTTSGDMALVGSVGDGNPYVYYQTQYSGSDNTFNTPLNLNTNLSGSIFFSSLSPSSVDFNFNNYAYNATVHLPVYSQTYLTAVNNNPSTYLNLHYAIYSSTVSMPTYTVGSQQVYSVPSTYIPIKITNTQSVPTPVNFTQLLTVNWSKYANYLNSNVSNVRFYSSTFFVSSNELYAMIWSNNTTTATSSQVWVNLSNNIIPAGGSIIIAMVFLSPSSSWSSHWGLKASLSKTYGQFDNGFHVFPFYANFAGTENYTYGSGIVDGTGEITFADHTWEWFLFNSTNGNPAYIFQNNSIIVRGATTASSSVMEQGLITTKTFTSPMIVQGDYSMQAYTALLGAAPTASATYLFPGTTTNNTNHIVSGYFMSVSNTGSATGLEVANSSGTLTSLTTISQQLPDQIGVEWNGTGSEYGYVNNTIVTSSTNSYNTLAPYHLVVGDMRSLTTNALVYYTLYYYFAYYAPPNNVMPSVTIGNATTATSISASFVEHNLPSHFQWNLTVDVPGYGAPSTYTSNSTTINVVIPNGVPAYYNASVIQPPKGTGIINPYISNVSGSIGKTTPNMVVNLNFTVNTQIVQNNPLMVPIKLYNNGTSAISENTIFPIHIDWQNYYPFIVGNVSDVRFYDRDSVFIVNELYAWLQSGNNYLDNTSTVWINLGANSISAHSTFTIYMYLNVGNDYFNSYWATSGTTSTTTIGYQIQSLQVSTIQFNETGLPSGASWTVNLSGRTITQNTPSITFLTGAGTYSYKVNTTNDAFYRINPEKGNVSVEAFNTTYLDVSFANLTYPIVFQQSTLLPGASWSVWLNNTTTQREITSTGKTITFYAVNGSYTYSVPTPTYEGVTDFNVSPNYGDIGVAGSFNYLYVINFTYSAYSVTFTQKGLTNPLTWTVSIDGFNYTATPSNTITFWGDAHKSYTATVKSSDLEIVPSQATYNVTLNSSQSFTVSFVITATIVESGYSGVWHVIVDGVTYTSSTNTIVAKVLPGELTISVWVSSTSYTITPSVVTYNNVNAPITVNVTFSSAPTNFVGSIFGNLTFVYVIVFIGIVIAGAVFVFKIRRR